MEPCADLAREGSVGSALDGAGSHDLLGAARGPPLLAASLFRRQTPGAMPDLRAYFCKCSCLEASRVPKPTGSFLTPRELPDESSGCSTRCLACCLLPFHSKCPTCQYDRLSSLQIRHSLTTILWGTWWFRRRGMATHRRVWLGGAPGLLVALSPGIRCLHTSLAEKGRCCLPES